MCQYVRVALPAYATFFVSSVIFHGNGSKIINDACQIVWNYPHDLNSIVIPFRAGIIQISNLNQPWYCVAKERRSLAHKIWEKSCNITPALGGTLKRNQAALCRLAVAIPWWTAPDILYLTYTTGPFSLSIPGCENILNRSFVRQHSMKIITHLSWEWTTVIKIDVGVVTRRKEWKRELDGISSFLLLTD